ncbi:hypothetical protein DSUL_20129 [Desulfovibrionales bacterium]
MKFFRCVDMTGYVLLVRDYILRDVGVYWLNFYIFFLE